MRETLYRQDKICQILAARKVPVTASVLAAQLNVSVRTVYRDVDSLRERGVGVRAEAGVGFYFPNVQLPRIVSVSLETERGLVEVHMGEFELTVKGLGWRASRTLSGWCGEGDIPTGLLERIENMHVFKRFLRGVV